MAIHAVYENGVFRPVGKVDLPESCEVEVEVRQVKPPVHSQEPRTNPGLAEIYRILGERYDSGFTDTAQRHNEHQP